MGFKILNSNIFGGFQKTEYFWGYEDFVDIFWSHHKIGLYLEVISMHLRDKVKNEGYFFGCQNFKYLFGVLEISDIFWG